MKDGESAENREQKKEGRARLKQGGGGEGIYRMMKEVRSMERNNRMLWDLVGFRKRLYKTDREEETKRGTNIENQTG